MIDPAEKKLSVSRQCRLLGICRSSRYYKSRRIQSDDLELMRLIDEQYLKIPSWGSRSMRNHLQRRGYRVNRKRIQRLMRLMGLEAIYPKPKTSRPHPGHKVYPYLLRNLKIDRPNQVWAADITFSAPRLGIIRGAYSWNAWNKKNEMPCFSLWKSMSPSGGGLLLTGRVT
jgi:putative transposase